MKPGVRITVLVDDRAGRDDLAAEHGLSLWIETPGASLLFDTGGSDAFLRNARKLGVDLSDADAVVLSHGHYDHSGGLASLDDKAPRAKLYLHPNAVLPHYARRDAPPHREIGMPAASSQVVRRMADRVVWTLAPTTLGDGIGVTGEVPRRTTYEHAGGPFFLDPACTCPDPIVDDQALWIDTPRGLVVVLGCAHAGVVNTLDYVRQLRPGARFHALIGGMHLLRASDERLQATVDALDRLGVRFLAPCHCTGAAAVDFLAQRFAGEFIRPAAGSEFVL